MSTPISPNGDARSLTANELARLHPRTDLAVLRQLLALIAEADFDDRHLRLTILGIAERGPLPRVPNLPVPEHSLVGEPKRLAFVTVPHESYTFLSDDKEISGLFERLFATDESEEGI
jgi:hypothetical protein